MVMAWLKRRNRVVTIVLDGLNEEDFRRSIQYRLREGSPAIAAARLRTLLAPYAGPGGLLPPRFLTVTADDLVLRGWNTLGDAMVRHDQFDRPVTAVSIAFGWPGEDPPLPDARGHLAPHIETSYYNDGTFPFSNSCRESLLESYSAEGSTWGGDPHATDNAIGLDGIDDLTGALAVLETQLLEAAEPDEAGLCAGSLGACLLSTLLIEAVTARIAKDGLPRPICVTAGSNGVYPYFDAPVAGMPAAVLSAAAAVDDGDPVATDVPGPRYSSLLVTSIPRARKRAVLVLEAATEQQAEQQAERFAALRSVPADQTPVAPVAQAAPAPVEEDDPVPIAADTTLLLAKKPPRPGYDFRDMLGPRQTDLQQRLQNLIAPHLPAPPPDPRAPDPAEPARAAADCIDAGSTVLLGAAERPGEAAGDEPAVNEPAWDDPAWDEPAARQGWQRWRPWARFKAWWAGSAG